MLGAGIYGVLGSPDIICGVVDPHDTVSVHCIFMEEDGIHI